MNIPISQLIGKGLKLPFVMMSKGLSSLFGRNSL